MPRGHHRLSILQVAEHLDETLLQHIAGFIGLAGIAVAHPHHLGRIGIVQLLLGSSTVAQAVGHQLCSRGEVHDVLG